MQFGAYTHLSTISDCFSGQNQMKIPYNSISGVFIKEKWFQMVSKTCKCSKGSRMDQIETILNKLYS